MKCPDCKATLINPRQCTQCGWKAGGAVPEEPPQRKAPHIGRARRQCAWNDQGYYCRDEGHMSFGTDGSGPWYCRKHMAKLRGEDEYDVESKDDVDERRRKGGLVSTPVVDEMHKAIKEHAEAMERRAGAQRAEDPPKDLPGPETDFEGSDGGPLPDEETFDRTGGYTGPIEPPHEDLEQTEPGALG